jgi:hypothetical protein
MRVLTLEERRQRLRVLSKVPHGLPVSEQPFLTVRFATTSTDETNQPMLLFRETVVGPDGTEEQVASAPEAELIVISQ